MTISLPLAPAVSVLAKYLLNRSFNAIWDIEQFLYIIGSVTIFKEQIYIFLSNSDIACKLLQLLYSGALKPFGVVLWLSVCPPIRSVAVIVVESVQFCCIELRRGSLAP